MYLVHHSLQAPRNEFHHGHDGLLDVQSRWNPIVWKVIQQHPKSGDNQRLAIFFTDLSERFGERGFSTCEFELTMTRSEIANYLGLADETISRLIARFKDKNLIQVQRKSIKIIARERMIEIAEGECSLDEI